MNINFEIKLFTPSRSYHHVKFSMYYMYAFCYMNMLIPMIFIDIYKRIKVTVLYIHINRYHTLINVLT